MRENSVCTRLHTRSDNLAAGISESALLFKRGDDWLVCEFRGLSARKFCTGRRPRIGTAHVHLQYPDPELGSGSSFGLLEFIGFPFRVNYWCNAFCRGLYLIFWSINIANYTMYMFAWANSANRFHGYFGHLDANSVFEGFKNPLLSIHVHDFLNRDSLGRSEPISGATRRDALDSRIL